jgi:hypothetical protein
MQMLNRYFVPFALILILSAIWFNVENPLDWRHWDTSYKQALVILAVSMLVNWYLSSHTYRYIHWAKQMKILQVWLYYLWAVPLFWLLQPFWGPMWLLFVMAPVTAALFTDRWQTLASAVVSAGTMLLVYYKRGLFQDGIGPQEGMVCVHAAFIIVFALFVYGLEQTALRLRDAALGRL